MPSSRFDNPRKFAFFDVHHWADWVELCCVEDLDETTFREDMEKRLQRALEGDDEELPAVAGALAQPIDEEDKDLVVTDATTAKVALWFNHLGGRATRFGDSYPFVVAADKMSIYLRDDLTSRHKVYLALLLMANLHYFDDFEADLTSDFERFSVRALQDLLPTAAQVHVFGKGPAASARYNGSVWERLTKLAEDLRTKLLAKEADFPPQSTGDGGLDLVGWVPWDDTENGVLAVFGQCGCTPQWDQKQHSSNPELWCSNKMTVPSAVNAVFSPYFLRNGEGAWQRPSLMGPYIHIDRLRLSALLEDHADDLQALDSFTHVDTVLAQKADPT